VHEGQRDEFEHLFDASVDASEVGEARRRRGIVGPPGCGKTMLAGAIAGELALPFISISAPSIVSGMDTRRLFLSTEMSPSQFSDREAQNRGRQERRTAASRPSERPRSEKWNGELSLSF
jgi:ATP-dependent Zn protease